MWYTPCKLFAWRGDIAMKVHDIIFCMKAINVEGEGVSANNVLSAINPEYIPGLFSFSVVFTILDIDYEKEQSLCVELVSPYGDRVVEIDGLLIPKVEIPDTTMPKEYVGINLAMDWVNVDFKCSGEYILNVFEQKQIIGSKTIFVKGKNER